MTIHHADILEWSKNYTGAPFHAALMDPPYGIDFMGRTWDTFSSADDDVSGAASQARTLRNKSIAYQKFSEDWLRAIWPHLYPGAWCMAFSSTRTLHRLMVAVEDAGYILQPVIAAWAFGSGFPKATNIAAGIDARAFRAWLDLHPEEHDRLKAVRALERAARRDGDASAVKALRTELKALSVAYKAQAGLAGNVVGTKKQTGAKFKLTQELIDNGGFNDPARETFDVMGAATEAASYWLGHRYGGQVLKPAIEPVIVFQRPYDGAALDCITRTGAGALWIDGARISHNDPERIACREAPRYSGAVMNGGERGGMQSDVASADPAGRWPANLILSHAPTCNGTCAPGCPVAALGAQSGERPVGGGSVNGGAAAYDGGWDDRSDVGYADSGTAARFFYQADYMAERMELADAIQYVAKSSRSEREAGLDPRQTALMRLLDDGDWDDFEGHEPQRAATDDRRCSTCGGWYPKKRRPTHWPSTCKCSDPTWVDFSETTVSDGRATPIDNAYQRGETTRRNTHPTIKPIGLTRYLATLLLPPAQYGPRRLLVPFAGAGSEVIGADLAGWEDVTGIELEADHVAIANARRAYWRQRRWELDDPARKLTIKASAKVPQGQADMFTEEVA